MIFQATLFSILLAIQTLAIPINITEPEIVDVNERAGRRTELHEGDIKYTAEQKRLIDQQEEAMRSKRQVTRIFRKWPNNQVFYQFSSDISAVKKELFLVAMNYISSKTCITFEESSTAANRLNFVSQGGGCASYIGMIGGVQKLWFEDDCVIFGTAVHELLHSLGLYHTQARYDRDNYLTVNYNLIPSSWATNFAKETQQSSYNSVPFEYGSTMQYRYDSFGTGTVVPKQTNYTRTMGSRLVTFYDIQMVNTHYSCSCPANLPCTNGGYTNPSNCSKCVCPDGYGGQLCDQLPNTNAVQIMATNNWISNYINFGFSDNVLYNTYYVATLWITAPPNTTIQFQLTGLSSFTCSYGCITDGVQPKVLADPRITNTIFCCTDDNIWNQIFSSKLNPMPIILYTRSGKSRMDFKYRYVNQAPTGNVKQTNGYDNYAYFV